MARIRSDLKFGTITDNPLAVGATSINSAQFASLPTVAGSDELSLTIDPEGSNREIVKVTAHSAAATVCTVVRGQLSTSAAQHAVGTRWVHGAISTDLVIPCTSTTRPTLGLWAGMTIFETDTNTIQVYDGAAWRQIAALGVWTAYTPTDTAITVGNGTRVARYRMIDPKTCAFRWSLKLGSTSTVGTNAAIGLPFTAMTSAFDLYQTAPAYYLDSGSRNYVGVARIDSAATTGVLLHTEAGGSGAVDGTNPFGAAWAANDAIGVSGVYEIG